MQKDTVPKQKYTFERSVAAKKILAPGFIDGAIDGTLRSAPGKEAYFMKSFLDQVPADDSDKEFVRDVDQAVEFRHQLTGFIIDNLHVYSLSDQPSSTKAYIQNAEAKMVKTLEAGEQTFSKYLRNRSIDPSNNKVLPRPEFEFNAGTFPTKKGNKVDFLAGGRISGMAVPITIQRQGLANFVQWTSQAYLESSLSGEAQQITRRIYLNPKIMDSVRIFSQVTAAADAAGLKIKGKIFDRSVESSVLSGQKKKRADHQSAITMRGDGIVLYALNDQDADRVLGIVEKIYEENLDSFSGRRTNRLPFRLADGLAIGDEPTEKDESLTTHRSNILSEVAAYAVENTRKSPKLDRQRIFTGLWRAAALSNNINPDNLAFNAQR
ncbi:MAG: T3SS effector HopA1 family protein [Candidatus Saccharimonadales bacterium]